MALQDKAMALCSFRMGLKQDQSLRGEEPGWETRKTEHRSQENAAVTAAVSC